MLDGRRPFLHGAD